MASAGSKFAALTLWEGASALTEPVHLGEGLSFHPRLPWGIGEIWERWLGTLRTKQVTEANLVVIAEACSDRPEVLDEEYRTVEKRVVRLYYALMLLGVPGYSRINLLKGSVIGGAPDVREVGRIPDYYVTEGVQKLVVEPSHATEAGRLGRALRDVYAGGEDYMRLRRGFNAFLRGLRQSTLCDRQHEFARSLEALIMAEPGRTRKRFVHRAQTFCALSEEMQFYLGLIY